MTQRPCLIVKATGERIYLDRRERRQEYRIRSAMQRAKPRPAIYLECELCGRAMQQVEWTRTLPPFICHGCTSAADRRRPGLKFGDVPLKDHDFLARAHAVLAALRNEVKNAR